MIVSARERRRAEKVTTKAQVSHSSQSPKESRQAQKDYRKGKGPKGRSHPVSAVPVALLGAWAVLGAWRCVRGVG